MQRLVLVMFVVVMLVPYLATGDGFGRARLLPGAAAQLPEALSALALIAVIALGVRDGFSRVRATYWIVFGVFLLVITCGAVANRVEAGPIIAGLRLYLRGIPWFFVPAVFAFTAIQLRTQLRWLLGLCLLQIPFAIEQRIKTGENVMGFVAVTGDWTTGTIGDAGLLTILLIGAACILAGLYSRQQLRASQFVPLLLLVLIPTTINESKVTFVLLPIGLMAALIAAAPPGQKLRRFLAGLAVLVAFGAIFVPVYDWMNEDRQDSIPLMKFLSSQEDLEAYLGGSKPADQVAIPGRVEAVTLPFSRLSQDAISLVFGYGIGNASMSNVGADYTGRYAYEYKDYIQSTTARVLLELGVSGLLFTVMIFWLITADSIHVARGATDALSGFAAGWTGIMAFILPAMLYTLLESSTPLSYPFWYFSGLVAAERMRRQQAQG